MALRVAILEPYYGGSHRVFVDTCAARSRHDVRVATLPARKWKWRMRGAAIWFAMQDRSWMHDGQGRAIDVILCNDMLGVSDLRALLPADLRHVPVVCYVHENQLTYPPAPDDVVDYQYGMTNITSCLSADRVLFNSAHHRAAFLEADDDPRRAELGALLAGTIAEQTAFLIARLARAVPGLIATAPPSVDVRGQLERVLRTPEGALSPAGLYALVDYNNFKGEGLDPAERYQGKGWGLLQVLETMAGIEGDGRDAFATAAAAMLERRVALAPPARREARWLAGWLRRVATYAEPGGGLTPAAR